MAYARYFKRGKKRYGPFYYKSVRMPDGRVKSVYLGKTLPKEETIETERRFTSRNVIIITLLVLIVIGVTSFTGYIILRPILVYHTETLNMTINTSQEYDWKPQNLGELNSIKLSGSVIGNGSVRVYIKSQGKRYLILDRSLLEYKNSTLFGFVPFVRAENIVNTTQDIVLNFVDICVDTCFLTDLNESSYKLVFEMENGTILEIMEINYTIVEIEVVEEKTEKLKELREKVIKLLPEKDNFKMNEKPRFRFTINESVEPEDLGMFVYDPDQKLSDMKANVLKVAEGEFDIELSKVRAFRPGVYRLIIRKETYEEQTEFLWGVLAINTHKSIYLENEEAFIGIAVLDNQGHMVCDADVTLSIINPRGEIKKLRTSDGTIEVSPECRVYGVTNLPDYYTYYSVSLAGTYTMNLTAITRNGVRTITDTFEVKKQVDFDVERNGPTRIYPPAKYKMIFTIKPKKDYEGSVIEYVPSPFDITPQNGLTITAAEDIKTLTWNMKLTEGYTHEVEYEFDAPDVSPYLFVLGALEIGNWKEARQWMIASDVPVEVGYCRNLDTADTVYELNQSVNSNSSACLNVTANNVTIDGKGYTLTYAITDTGIGVNSNGYSQITIKNLIVTQTNTTRTNSPAIRIYSGQDNQIINNTIDVYGENSPDAYNYGIRFRNVTNTTIVNNTIITRTTCDYCHGIYLTTGSHNHTIEHNSITTIGDNSHGIYSTGSSQQTIYNNTIDMQDYYSRGIYLYNSSNNIINQTTITADQQADVMRIEQYSSDNIITNSNMTNLLAGGWGIRIDTYSDDNNITNVNITVKYYAIT
ncbi:MAG: right-handed parallel beta-helix repeat-containing protein [Candidatus Aenigmatarchaeota archaeon]|nr:MAG: right-handed parallel beta-helix repeat-containing protein [Candidatus Aenigmarchaeota archaeon]